VKKAKWEEIGKKFKEVEAKKKGKVKEKHKIKKD